MLFAGRGQDEEKLAALVQELGLAEEVVMCGLTDKPMLEKLYSRASLFLFPSLYDANSLVQIEAAHRDLYLSWDDVVRDVHADYLRLLARS